MESCFQSRRFTLPRPPVAGTRATRALFRAPKKTKVAHIIRANDYACSSPNYDVRGLVADPNYVIEIRQCSGADSTNDVTDFDEIVGRKSRKLISEDKQQSSVGCYQSPDGKKSIKFIGLSKRHLNYVLMMTFFLLKKNVTTHKTPWSGYRSAPQNADSEYSMNA